MDGQKSIQVDGYKKYKSLIIERWMIKYRYSLITIFFETMCNGGNIIVIAIKMIKFLKELVWYDNRFDYYASDWNNY